MPPLSSPRGKKPLGKRTGRGTPLSSTLPDLSNAYRFLLRYLFPSWLLVRLVSRLSSAEMILRNSPLPTTPRVSVFAEWRNDDTSDDGGCETIFIRMASRTKWNRNVRRLFLGVCVRIYIHTMKRVWEMILGTGRGSLLKVEDNLINSLKQYCFERILRLTEYN